MVHRTHLTTPPGQDPVLLTDGAAELYTSGLALPTEPKVPIRHRAAVFSLVALLVLALAVWVGFQLVTSGQDFDPSLDVRQPEQQDGFDPTIPGPDGG